MANHTSAVKRHRQSEKRKTHNRWWKSRVRTAAKAITDAVEKKETSTAADKLKTAMSEINKAKREGVIHANTAARKISRLSKKLAVSAK